MSLEERYSAKSVAALALGASLWLFVSISLMFLPWPDVLLGHHKIDWLWMSIDIAWLLFGIIAGVLMYRALAAFQCGIDAQLWDRPSIDRLKGRLDQPAVTAAIWVSAIAAVGYLIFDILSRHPGSGHHSSGIGGLAYFWLSPFTAVAYLRRSLKPRREPSQSIWRDELKPIISNHWGHRGPAQS